MGILPDQHAHPLAVALCRLKAIIYFKNEFIGFREQYTAADYFVEFAKIARDA